MTAGVTRKPLQKIHDDCAYYPHQLEGIRTGAQMTNFLLADEMGLGKSLQALTVAAIDFERQWARRVLVVCPAPLKWNWEDEIKKHTNFTSVVLHGDPTERDKQFQLFQMLELDILIVNYEQVVKHLDSLNELGFDIVIYDEAHLIKNPTAKRTLACLALRGSRHILLTGSPMLNNVNELWSILHRINPDKFPDYWRFLNRYAVFGGYKGKQIVSVKNRHELNTHLEQVMIRRLKKDVLDLPDKLYIPIYVDLHSKQRVLYDIANNDLEIIFPGKEERYSIENPLVKYGYLTGIAATLAYVEGYEDVSSKLDVVVDKILEIITDEADKKGEPVVVFTKFRIVLKCLEQRLAKVGVPLFQLHGDVQLDTRQEVVAQWAVSLDQKGRRCVLGGMLQVAGVGLNLTAASKCIFVDKLFVPKMNEQAEDRLHRIGADMTKPIEIIDIIARKTVEQKIATLLKKKSKLFDTLVEESDWKRELMKALMEEDNDEWDD